MTNPIFEIKSLLLDSKKFSGVVGNVEDGKAEVFMPSGVMVLPYDIPVRRGDVVTVLNNRIVSKQSLGEGTVHRV